MPRNSTGQYSLPAGNPVADSTVISSTWANPTMGDLANEITQSLDRNGRGGMLVAFKNVDGTKAAPGVTFTTEPSSGIYRAATNDIRMSVGNDDATRWVDDNSQPVGSQRPFQIWDGGAFRDVLYEGGSLPQLLPDGTVSAPSLAFVSETTLGLYKKAAGVLGVAGNLDVTGALTAGTLTAGSGSVTDSSGAISFGDENLSTTGTLASGNLDVTGTLGTSGTIRGGGGFTIPNNSPLRGETTSSGTARMVQMSATNVIEVGATSQALELNATTTTVNSDLVVTGDIEASERIRLGNNKLLQARNQQNTQWRPVLTVDTNNDLVIGSSATPITLDVDTTVDGDLTVNGYIKPLLTATIPTWDSNTYVWSESGYGARFDGYQMKFDTGSARTTALTIDISQNVSIPNGGLRVSNYQATPLTNEGLYGGHPSRGAYIQGHGSANDFTVANQAGTIALAVPQNTINVEARGDLEVSGDINAVGIIESGTYSNVGATSGCKIFQTGTVTISTTSTSTVNRINFYNPNGQVGRIRTSGSTTSYVTTSDPRLKSEFTPITNASEMILEARDQGMIGEFHFLADPTQTVWGYNAHKLIDAQPNFGGSEGEGSRDAPLGDDVTPAGVDQSERVPILEAAIGELLDRIKVLESV